MTNSRARGNKFELEVKKHYELHGWTVERALAKLLWIPGKKFPISQSHDFFGLWDLICIDRWGNIDFVQVSTTNEISTKRKMMQSSNFNFSEHSRGLIFARVLGKSPIQYKTFCCHSNWTKEETIILRRS